jgi:hypothetical protein
MIGAGIRRTKGSAPTKKKAARTKVINALVAPLGTSLSDVRDRALLLIGFAGALRRSELVALNIDDINEDDEGLVVTIRRSKGDQEAHGEKRGLPYGSRPATCPVRAWRAWLDALGITEGAAFRAVTRHGHLRTTRLGDRAIADMIKRRAQHAGVAGVRAGGLAQIRGWVAELASACTANKIGYSGQVAANRRRLARGALRPSRHEVFFALVVGVVRLPQLLHARRAGLSSGIRLVVERSRKRCGTAARPAASRSRVGELRFGHPPGRPPGRA